MSEFSPKDDTDWNKTILADERHGRVYQGRPRIARDTKISGGVYMGAGDREAIVVDPNKYPEAYKPLFDKVIERSRDVEKKRFGRSKVGEVQKGKIMDAVFQTVKEALPYSEDGVNKILTDMAVADGIPTLEDNAKVELSSFINNQAGVCRHQALLCGVLLEGMKDRGYISGTPSVDRNQQWDPSGETGGHAWTRYTNSAGEVFILDVAQDFIGTLAESQERVDGWNYLHDQKNNDKAQLLT